jgi:Tol biopolymer transport system component
MGRLAVVSAAVLLGATACGTAASLRSAVPLPNVLVYAKPRLPLRLAWKDPTDTVIWRSRVDGTQAKQLASGNYPALSPDGRFIAFGRDRTELVMPAAGGVPERVYTFTTKGTGPYDVRWTPDSRHLAFEGNNGFVVLDPISRVQHILPKDVGYYGGFSFSPDSRRIVYAAKGDLYVITARGGRPVRLTFDHRNGAPVWGKPGMAFFRYTHGSRELSDIWLRDGKTHHIRQLTHRRTGAAPVAFSADGKELLAAYWPSHSGRLWAVDVASGTERPVTPWVGDLIPQGLSADGSTVLAMAGCGVGPMFGTVETIPFGGGKPHIVVNGPCGASWNAR